MGANCDKIIKSMKSQTKNQHKAWAEINLENLSYNYHKIRKIIGENVKFLGVVKADAYGHGAVRIAQELQKLGADYLGVANIDEAIELRLNGVELPILVFGITYKERVLELARLKLTQMVPNLEWAKIYNRALKQKRDKLKIHIKLDTGMSRFGLKGDDALSCRQQICEIFELSRLEAEGIFTHFSSADQSDAAAIDFTNRQLDIFRQIIDGLPPEIQQKIKIRHAANSAATVNFPDSHFDMVRPGLILYGQGKLARKLGLKPVMSLKTRVELTSEIPAGRCVGYGCGWRAKVSSRIGVIACGYNDGLNRKLSNNYSVWLAGGLAPIRGKVCMDVAMIDLTGLDKVKIGDEVEIFGENNQLEVMAEKAETIEYELLCSIGRRVKRIYH